MKKVALALLLSTSLATAADLPVKSPQFGGPYPTQGCGGYYGVNTLGSAAPIQGGVVGASVIQGDIGLTVGYTCVTNSGANFWFAEGLFDIANVNGGANGLSLTGPAHFEQRIAFGGPISGMLNLFPNLNFPAVPALPTLPGGVTASSGNGYFHVTLSEQDVSAQFGNASNRNWMLRGGGGVGLLYRLNNGVVADTWVTVLSSTNAVCIGPGGCPKLGTGVEVGFALKY